MGARMRCAMQQRVPSIPPERGAEWVPTRFWQVAGVPVTEALAAGTAPSSEAVQAYVNEGRWVVSCPDCAGAQLACRTDHRFLCNECANYAVDGLWRPVVWPADADAVEQALVERRLPRTRNWVPGETPDGLRLEQAAHEAMGR